MIRLGIISDLHSEFWTTHHIEHFGAAIMQNLRDADIILLPGDIGLGTDGIAIARALFPDKPVFMVAGNHEFYQGDYDEVLRALQLEGSGGNIHFLHQSAAEIIIRGSKLRILGTTLWTDFELQGNRDLALLDARKGLNDFRLITHGGAKLTPEATLEWHREQRAWIERMLDTPFDGTTILMTHHAPVSFGVHPRFKHDRLSPCFCSKLEDILTRDDLPLVVWGHTHHCVDFVIDHTRFVSNQSGYPVSGGSETGQFGQIVTLDTGSDVTQPRDG